MKIHDSTMWPVENSPEPASAPFITGSAHSLCLKKNLWWNVTVWILSSYNLNAVWGHCLALWWQSSLKICKVRIQAPIKVFKESDSLLHKVEGQKGKDLQTAGEGGSKHFIFKNFTLGLPHSYACIPRERQREREREFMMNSSLFLTESTPAQEITDRDYNHITVLFFFPLNQACVRGTIFIQDGILKLWTNLLKIWIPPHQPKNGP